LELSYFEDKFDRFDSIDALLAAVKELQHYAILGQRLLNGYCCAIGSLLGD